MTRRRLIRARPAIIIWTLAFTFPKRPGDQRWNGTFSQSGQHVNVTSETYNGTLAADYAPGASISLDATASEPTASISKVEFFEVSVLPGASSTPTLNRDEPVARGRGQRIRHMRRTEIRAMALVMRGHHHDAVRHW